jgi:hypothetical protein
MALEPAEIDAIAERLAELIAQRAQTRARLVDASELARLLAVRRSWVYEHAKLLGAVRLDGPRGRLRFDPDEATRALRRTSERMTETTGEARSGRRPRRRSGGVDLLPF